MALFNPDMVILDCEERYNAGHALMLAEDHADAVLRLQYRNFCGGCTFTAIVGAGLMSIAGTSWLAWKGVALLFTAVLAAVGTLLLERQIGRSASVAWVLLLCFAPLNWIRLSLLSWGNHVEAGVWAICIVAMLLRSDKSRWHFGTGALCGGAIWFGFSSLFAVVGAFGYRVLQRQWKPLGWMAAGFTGAIIVVLAMVTGPANYRLAPSIKKESPPQYCRESPARPGRYWPHNNWPDCGVCPTPPWDCHWALVGWAVLSALSLPAPGWCVSG